MIIRRFPYGEKKNLAMCYGLYKKRNTNIIIKKRNTNIGGKSSTRTEYQSETAYLSSPLNFVCQVFRHNSKLTQINFKLLFTEVKADLLEGISTNG